VKLTVLYDNNPPTAETGPTDPPLRTGWGFSCLVVRGDLTMLFDTGGDAGVLRSNFQALDLDPGDVDALVLSHYHSDHTGGIDAVLGAGAPAVFLPSSFPSEFKARLAQRTSVVEVTGPAKIAEGIRSTGGMGTEIIEQSLVIETRDGLAVITGCAHPGIVEIVRNVAAAGTVGLVVGGFHLRHEDATTCAAIVSEIHGLGVKRVAPTHCTGDVARRAFAAVFGDDYLPVGVGSIIEISA
jgi:7,8-dihydropterin-6-yl-methyl-4-(beta-D-ribofuranosyl)aminobenzene 5'-phosphate synthase